MDSRRKIYDINCTLKEEYNWKERYESQKEKIKMHPIKQSHVLLCGGIMEMVALGSSIPSGNPANILLNGTIGLFVGMSLPYVVKKVRIFDKDYQLYFVNSNIKDLTEKKNKLKTLKK